MSFIVRYQKVIDEHTTHQMALPYDVNGEQKACELCTISDMTYVAVQDDAQIPSQPPQITFEPVQITPELRSQISRHSPVCRLIKERGHRRIIDAGFDEGDQRKLDRMISASGAGIIALTPGQQVVVDGYVAINLAADAWAAGQYEQLGL